MGLGPKFSRSSYDKKCSCNTTIVNNLPNPNPFNYRILDYFELDGNLLVKIKYPDCTNYEGIKILLYKNCRVIDLAQQISVDPHFSENKSMKSPFARFEPTESGWNTGLYLIKQMERC